MRSLCVENFKIILWIFAVLAFLLLFSAVPELKDPKLWSGWIRADSIGFWLVWIALQAACAVFMIPTLPLVLAAAIALPEHQALVLLMSLIGVLCSALAIYRNASWLGLKQQVSVHPRLLEASGVIRKHGTIGLMLWCAAPFLPSDFGCYVAASSGMSRGRYLIAVLCGEAVLCASIVYGASKVLT
jgi:uncharacterized membrane protein YdjX (TVP38/TMEM64 family)